MPQINLEILQESLHGLPEEELVATDLVSPYLLNRVILPLQRNETVCYGDLDYDQFDDLELRNASSYCDSLSSAAYELERLTDSIQRVTACSIKRRAFC